MWETLILIGLCFENVLNWSLHAYNFFDCNRSLNDSDE